MHEFNSFDYRSEVAVHFKETLLAIKQKVYEII